MRATHPSALARATPRPTDGDGDGPRGHGRTPVECRAHCASSKGRQRHVARVEPVGRGGTNGGGVALRPPFTPRRSPQRARNEIARGEAAEGGKAVGWGSELATTAWKWGGNGACCEKIAKAPAGVRGVGRRCMGSLSLWRRSWRQRRSLGRLWWAGSIGGSSHHAQLLGLSTHDVCRPRGAALRPCPPLYHVELTRFCCCCRCSVAGFTG